MPNGPPPARAFKGGSAPARDARAWPAALLVAMHRSISAGVTWCVVHVGGAWCWSPSSMRGAQPQPPL